MQLTTFKSQDQMINEMDLNDCAKGRISMLKFLRSVESHYATSNPPPSSSEQQFKFDEYLRLNSSFARLLPEGIRRTNICQLSTNKVESIKTNFQNDILDTDLAKQAMIQVDILRHLKTGNRPPVELIHLLKQFAKSCGLPMPSASVAANSIFNSSNEEKLSYPTPLAVKRAWVLEPALKLPSSSSPLEHQGELDLNSVPPRKRAFMTSSKTSRELPSSSAHVSSIVSLPPALRARAVLEKKQLQFASMQQAIRERVDRAADLSSVPRGDKLPSQTALLSSDFSGSTNAMAALDNLPFIKSSIQQDLIASRLGDLVRGRGELLRGRDGKVCSAVRNFQREMGAIWSDKRGVAALMAAKCAEVVNSMQGRRTDMERKGEKERLRLLRESNMEEYLSMVKESKNERLQQLLSQTETFLSDLLKRAREHQRIDRSVSDAPRDKSNTEMDVETNQTDQNNSLSLIEEKSSSNTGLFDYYNATHLRREKICQPPNLAPGRSLMSYQLTGLEWLISLFNNNLHGILADEMGLGKTVMTISLFAHLLDKFNHTGPHLVVVPLSTLPNWLSEAEAFCPSLRMIGYKGTANDRASLGRMIKNSRLTTNLTHSGVTSRGTIRGEGMGYKTGVAAVNAAKKRGFDVVVTTYEYILRDVKVFQSTIWGHLVVDEGHRLKNVNSRLHRSLSSLKCMSRLLLTGTPLQNNLTELWSLLNFLLPHIFSSSDDFESWFASPFESSIPGAASEDLQLTTEERLLIVHRLHQTLRPFVLRRVKKDVLSQLPVKKEFVVWAPLSSWQVRLYAQASNKSITVAKNENGDPVKDHSTGAFGATLNAIQQLSKQQKYVSNVMVELRKACNHPFHYLTEWRACSNAIGSPSATEIRDGATGAWDGLHDDLTMRMRAVSGKIEVLERMLVKLFRCNHKVLLFAQHTTLIDMVDAWLRCMSGVGVLAPGGLKIFRLDGSVSLEERKLRMDEFNKNDEEKPNGQLLSSKIFLISTRAGGTGLNLQSADTVIIFDSDWNPQQDLQAMARAHRVGQLREVRVIRLLTLTPFEETVMSRVESKLGLDSAVIGELTTNGGGAIDDDDDGGDSSETGKLREREDRLKALIAIQDSAGGESGRELSTLKFINSELARGEDEEKLFKQIDRELLIGNVDNDNHSPKVEENTENVLKDEVIDKPKDTKITGKGKTKSMVAPRKSISNKKNTKKTKSEMDIEEDEQDEMDQDEDDEDKVQDDEDEEKTVKGRRSTSSAVASKQSSSTSTTTTTNTSQTNKKSNKAKEVKPTKKDEENGDAESNIDKEITDNKSSVKLDSIPDCISMFANEFETSIPDTIALRDALLDLSLEEINPSVILNQIDSNPAFTAAKRAMDVLIQKFTLENFSTSNSEHTSQKNTQKKGMTTKKKDEVVDVDNSTMLLTESLTALTRKGQIDPSLILLLLTGRMMLPEQVPSFVLDAERHLSAKVKRVAESGKKYLDDYEHEMLIEREQRLAAGDVSGDENGDPLSMAERQQMRQSRRGGKTEKQFLERIAMLSGGVFTSEGIEYLDEEDLKAIDGEVRELEKKNKKLKKGQKWDEDSDF